VSDVCWQAEGVGSKHFANPKENDSHYFRPLSFHGAGPCRQHGAKQNTDSHL